MGSTSFNLLIADVTDRGDIIPVRQKRWPLRLGRASINQGGQISPKMGRKALETASEVVEIMRQEGDPILYPIATSALREARNGNRWVASLGRTLGAPVRVLSGREEAKIFFRAIQERVDFKSDLIFGIDLGGGSLEVTIGDRQCIDLACTLPLGAVRLNHELVSEDPISQEEQREIRRRVKQELAPYAKKIEAAKVSKAVVAGGTARALAQLFSMQQFGCELEEDEILTVDLGDLKDLNRTLVGFTHKKRLAMPGMRARRADILPVGCLVLLTVLKEVGLKELTFSDWGLREGVLLSQVTDRGLRRL